jgi:hypothetical protein
MGMRRGLFRYGNKTNKCAQIYKSILYYKHVGLIHVCNTRFLYIYVHLLVSLPYLISSMQGHLLVKMVCFYTVKNQITGFLKNRVLSRLCEPIERQSE